MTNGDVPLYGRRPFASAESSVRVNHTLGPFTFVLFQPHLFDEPESDGLDRRLFI